MKGDRFCPVQIRDIPSHRNGNHMIFFYGRREPNLNAVSEMVQSVFSTRELKVESLCTGKMNVGVEFRMSFFLPLPLSDCRLQHLLPEQWHDSGGNVTCMKAWHCV